MEGLQSAPAGQRRGDLVLVLTEIENRLVDEGESIKNLRIEHGHALAVRWDHAMATRNVREMYWILSRCGVSQRTIGMLTGQSQSEISEILDGRRVSHYDVLVSIASGLQIERSRMGLAYDERTETLLTEAP